ncbi:MAG TPA: SHOCT domain-containing protein [Ignavibacteria bacterium]|nr:SHOCT domain-containing protein [Ignavibacteria bacterium]
MMFGGIFWLLLLAVIVWFVFQLLNKNQNIGNTKSESAMDILNKRYAKGEVTKEEYEEMKRNLS